MEDVNQNVTFGVNVGIFNTPNHYAIKLQETSKISVSPPNRGTKVRGPGV